MNEAERYGLPTPTAEGVEIHFLLHKSSVNFSRNWFNAPLPPGAKVYVHKHSVDPGLDNLVTQPNLTYLGLGSSVCLRPIVDFYPKLENIVANKLWIHLLGIQENKLTFHGEVGKIGINASYSLFACFKKGCNIIGYPERSGPIILWIKCGQPVEPYYF